MKRMYIIGLIALIITLLVFMDTYALFETNGASNTEFEIGKWKILVNDEDISVEKSITLNDFVYTGSEHTEQGYFAPGESATFDVEIDTALSDVSVEYNLSIDDTSVSEYPNIYFSIKNLDTDEELSTNNYAGVINLNDTNRVITLRISLVWEDDEEYDESDTSLIGSDLRFLINANFKQYIGE